MIFSFQLKDESEFELNCSICGAAVRTDVPPTSEKVCLICHARLLNAKFQRLQGSRAVKHRRRTTRLLS